MFFQCVHSFSLTVNLGQLGDSKLPLSVSERVNGVCECSMMAVFPMCPWISGARQHWLGIKPDWKNDGDGWRFTQRPNFI